MKRLSIATNNFNILNKKWLIKKRTFYYGFSQPLLHAAKTFSTVTEKNVMNKLNIW